MYQYRSHNPKTLDTIINESIDLKDPKTFRNPANPTNNIEKIANKIKIASLSENNTNIPMWKHYADNHKGLCIEYDISNFNHENEYRIISYNTKANHIQLPINAIYLGKEATDETRATIKKLITGKNIDLYQIETAEDNLFEINPTKIL